MKSLHLSELQIHTTELKNAWLDSKVQKIFCTENGLGLELFKAHKSLFVWFDMVAHAPAMLGFDRLPSTLKLKKVTPIALFLRAHLVGKRLTDVKSSLKSGRVLIFEFGYDDILELEVRLFPHGENIIARFESSQISMHIVKELEEFVSQNVPPENLRSWHEFSTEWQKSKQKVGVQKTDPSVLKNKEIEKTKKTLSKIEEQIQSLYADTSMALGQWLKTNQNLAVPTEYKKAVDLKKNLAWNIQNSFEKGKKVKEKLEGILTRKAQVQNDLKDLEARDLQTFGKSPQVVRDVKASRPWKGYRFPLNEKMEVYVGRSAIENLEVLRYAQAWDIWVHLKDHPGAHGVIRRPRSATLSDSELKKVAQFVAAKSKKSAQVLKAGDSFEILYTECRFVKPIKGDKLGRVNYSNEKVLLCRFA